MKKEKTPREHFIVIENLLFVGVGTMVVSAILRESLFSWILLIAGLLLSISACIYQAKFYKCPHCGGKLNVRGIPKFCPDCGKPLEEMEAPENAQK